MATGSPITWQQIEGNTGVNAGQTMADAVRTIMGATNIAKQGVDAYDQGQVDIQKQEFMNRLTGATTPEALQALQASGALDRSGMDSRAQASTNGAYDARLASVMGQATQQQAFKDQQTDVANRPIIQEANDHFMNGRFEEAKRSLQKAAATPATMALMGTYLDKEANNRLAYKRIDQIDANIAAHKNSAEVDAARIKKMEADAAAKVFTEGIQAKLANTTHAGGIAGTMDGNDYILKKLKENNFTAGEIESIMNSVSALPKTGAILRDTDGAILRNKDGTEKRDMPPAQTILDAALEKRQGWYVPAGMSRLKSLFMGSRGDEVIEAVGSRMITDAPAIAQGKDVWQQAIEKNQRGLGAGSGAEKKTGKPAKRKPKE